VSKYIVTSETVKFTLKTREQIDSEKIIVIPNGIIIEEDGRKPPQPTDWPVFSPRPVLGTVGRLSPEKGHRQLLEALAILRQQDQIFQAIFIGDGPFKNELLLETKELRLEEYVSWVGPQTNVMEWLPYFDLFVLSSHWEGISQALLEAMAASLPVVATAVGGNLEVIENELTGYLVPPNNPQQLASAIHELLKNPEKRQQMGRLGKIRCQEKFNLDTVITEIDTLYRKLLSIGI
jgi:glycosyltransferase involved in cell wall biosynthesis